ncbi:hypothetical protein F5Y03DRAFT_354838 [Xylaria venustula]|nr:hypothetical protein F5Y03DRAFT_354838 [Xylaria venustula]
MFIRTSAAIAAAAVLAGQAAAKTDIAGCVSSETVAYGGASLIWYVPDTGEICAFLDCGGGRGPPATTVPGCPEYSGTATYSPSYLPGFGATATSTSSSSPVEATATESSASGHASSSSSSEKSTITSPPATTITGTVTPSESVDSSESVETQKSSDSAAATTSASTASNSSAASSTSSVSSGGAAVPTGPIKGAFGVLAGMAAGVALL